MRRWALILGFILAGVILVHAGALRGIGDALAVRQKLEDRLAEKLTSMSKEQATGIAEANAQASANRSQRERLAVAGKSAAQQGDVAKNAQRELAQQIVKSADEVKRSAIVPIWYLDGWMYAAIFILSLAFVGVIFLLMMNGEDIDADFDGIPDFQEQGRDYLPGIIRGREAWEFARRESAPVEKPRAVWRGGQRIDPNAPVVEPPKDSRSH